MVKVALFVQLEAKPGKEADVENFLLGGLPLVERGTRDHSLVRNSHGTKHVWHFRCIPG